MSGPPKRGVPAKKKVSISSSGSSLGPTDSQTSVYKKTTIKTVVEKRSRHGKNEPQTSKATGTRPATRSLAATTSQQSQCSTTSTCGTGKPKSPTQQAARGQRPSAKTQAPVQKRSIATSGVRVFATPMPQSRTVGGVGRPQSMGPASASRTVQRPATASGTGTKQPPVSATKNVRQIQSSGYGQRAPGVQRTPAVNQQMLPPGTLQRPPPAGSQLRVPQGTQERISPAGGSQLRVPQGTQQRISPAGGSQLRVPQGTQQRISPAGQLVAPPRPQQIPPYDVQPMAMPASQQLPMQTPARPLQPTRLFNEGIGNVPSRLQPPMQSGLPLSSTSPLALPLSPAVQNQLRSQFVSSTPAPRQMQGTRIGYTPAPQRQQGRPTPGVQFQTPGVPLQAPAVRQIPQIQTPAVRQIPQIQTPAVRQIQAPTARQIQTPAIRQVQSPAMNLPSQVSIQPMLTEPIPAPRRTSPSRLQAPTGIRTPLPRRLASPATGPIPAQGLRNTAATTQLQTPALPGRRTRLPSPGGAYPRQLPLPTPGPSQPQRRVPSPIQTLMGTQQAPMDYAKFGAIPKTKTVKTKHPKTVKKVSSVKITSEKLPSPRRQQRQELQKSDSRLKASSCGKTCPSKAGGSKPSPPTLSPLERELEKSMIESMKHHTKTPFKGSATRRTLVSPPMMMTDQGPVQASSQIISRKTVIKEPGMQEIIARDLIGIQTLSPTEAEKTEVAIQRSKPLKPSQMSKSKEMVIIESTVTTAPGGLQQSVKTVSFDGDPIHVQQVSPKPSPRQIAQLVQQETDLINQFQSLNIPMPEVKHVSPISYLVRKKATGYAIEPQAVAALEQSVLESGIKSPPDPEEPTPEMLAMMMNAEERGLAMGATPTNVYEYLFPKESSDQPVIEVTSAVPAPLQDVVVPSIIPDLSEGNNIAEIREVADKAGVELSMDAVNAASYCATVGDDPIPAKNIGKKGNKTKRKRVTMLHKEAPPWAIKDVPPVIDLVGASLNETKVVRQEAMEEVDPMEEGIEYLLQMEAPEHNTLIQLRGAQKPSWFPGYYLSLPETDHLISVAKSPSVVLSAAWKAVQPDVFNDNSIFVN